MTSETHANMSRRSLLAGAGLGAGAAGLAAISTAQAALLPQPAASETFDVVVIGTGIAGCAAALEAASRGASVIVLEKATSTWMGGNSLLAGGTFSMPADESGAARDDYVEEYLTATRGQGNAEIFSLMAAHAREDVAWLGSHGVELLAPSASASHRLATVTAAPGSFSMPRAFRVLRERIAALGGAFAFNTKARQLVLDESGAVAGVRAAGSGGLIEYRARAVVLATGGYAGNSQILEAYAHPDARALKVSGVERATGDGLAMAQAAGAGLKGMGGLSSLLVVPTDPVESAAGVPFGAIPAALSINRQGRRFADESLGYAYHGREVFAQEDRIVSLVFDHATRESPAVSGIVGTYSRLGIEVVEADTLDGLAARIGVPAQPFRETVEAFNAAVADGAAKGVHPPKAAQANRVETAPFYALHPITAGILVTFGGVMIDGRARVLEPDGRVIPGLFAAGEGAGAVFFHGYIGGGSLTNCLVMGRIAGREASAG